MNAIVNAATLPMITNEHGQSYREGSDEYRYPSLDRVLYVHRGTQEMVEYKGKKPKAVSSGRWNCSAAGFEKSVESHQFILNNDERRMAEYIQEAEELRQSCKVGDVFYAAWGSDQTNISYYQITEIKGATVSFQKIQSERIEDKLESGVSAMRGKCIPLIGQFVNTKVIKKRFPKCGSFALESYMFLHPLKYSVDPITGSRIYEPKTYTAYA